MNRNQSFKVSRRHFLGSALFASAAICFTPRHLFAGDGSPVTIIRDAAATAKINATKLFDSEQTLHLNGSTVALKKYSPAHTDSDISVEFTDADIVHVADTFWNGHFPFIDYSTGGSIDGMIRAAETNVAKVTDKTIVIPWHGPIGNKSQLTEVRDMLLSVREKVADLKNQ